MLRSGRAVYEKKKHGRENVGHEAFSLQQIMHDMLCMSAISTPRLQAPMSRYTEDISGTPPAMVAPSLPNTSFKSTAYYILYQNPASLLRSHRLLRRHPVLQTAAELK